MEIKRKSVSELCEVASKLTEELLKSLSINEALGVLEITKAQIDAAVTAHCVSNETTRSESNIV